MFLAKLGYVGLAVDLYAETAEYSYADRNPIIELEHGQKPARAAGSYVNMHDINLMEYWMVSAIDTYYLPCLWCNPLPRRAIVSMCEDAGKMLPLRYARSLLSVCFLLTYALLLTSIAFAGQVPA